MDESTRIKDVVRQKYGEAARRAGTGGGCCGGGTSSCCDPITSNLYESAEALDVPAAAREASLGCGNPTAIADLKPGEVVLDLGSGGGIDVILSARRVGPTGKAYGLDMTDEMLALAERNRAAAGAANVRFLKGSIERIPLDDASVDVVISNCVINLSPDKGRALREAFRVLRPGGRFAVSDVVLQGTFPKGLRDDLQSWAGCVAGALEVNEYRTLLEEAGFLDVEFQVTRAHDPADFANAAGGCCGSAVSGGSCAGGSGASRAAPDGRIVSAFVRARRP